MALQKVRLLIIDEVHLLNDERGAVIETIVARTLRQVSFFQSGFDLKKYSFTFAGRVQSIGHSYCGAECHSP